MHSQVPLQTTPVILDGFRVRLEPLNMDHLPALAEFAISQEIWRWMPDRMENEGDLRRYIQKALDLAAVGTAMPWATRSKAGNRVIGSTRFAEIHAANRTVVLGWTWLHPGYQRTGINVEAKYLQLIHAFEVMGVRRVALRTHHQNLQSQTAILALGAKFEGIMRNHVIMPDGSTRHSYLYSIIAEDWPEMKAHLERRIQLHAQHTAPTGNLSS